MTGGDVFTILWRRRLFFAVVFLLSMVIIAGVTLSLPRRWSASATLYAGGATVDKALAADTNLGQQLARTFTTLAANPNVADLVRARLPFRETRDQLLARMSFAPVEQTQLVQITAEGDSPTQAQQIANTYASVYSERVAEQYARGETGAKLFVNEPAALPTKPSKPNRPLYIGLGVLLASAIAAAAALLRERLDRRIKVADGDSTVLDVPILARIPHFGRNWSLSDPDVADAFRLLRTNLSFLAPTGLNSVVVTSPRPGEGKSSVASHLAALAAAEGERVVLIEADFRRPALDRAMQLEGWKRNSPGLSQYLAGRASLEEVLFSTPSQPLLHTIWSGPMPAAPSAALGSSLFNLLIASLQREFGLVIVDSPPVSVGADASLIASQVDAVVYILDVGSTDRIAAAIGLNQLRKADVHQLGVLLNNDRSRFSSYSGYYADPDRAEQAPVVGLAAGAARRVAGRS